MFDIPILLICFNRPSHVKKVLERVVSITPKTLFVFQDHWREDVLGEKELCQQVYEVVMKIVRDSCLKIAYFSPECNMGCGMGPKMGLDWFFSKNEMGIIIEDDALPHPDFFEYCRDLLIRYKDNNDIWAIGSMKIGDKKYGDGSYYFSMMNRTFCAWATWANRWSKYDFYHRNLDPNRLNSVLKEYGCNLRMREYWIERLHEIQLDALHNSSWDQQFWISIWMHKGMGIMPNENLCTNIGFDKYATHTTDSNSAAANVVTNFILPMIHPSSHHIKKDADAYFQQTYFEPYNYGWEGIKRLPFRLNKRLKRLLGHEGSWF